MKHLYSSHLSPEYVRAVIYDKIFFYTAEDLADYMIDENDVVESLNLASLITRRKILNLKYEII